MIKYLGFCIGLWISCGLLWGLYQLKSGLRDGHFQRSVFLSGDLFAFFILAVGIGPIILIGMWLFPN